MKRFSLAQLWRKRPGLLLAIAGVALVLALLATLLLTGNSSKQIQTTLLPATATAQSQLPTPTARPVLPTPTPTIPARFDHLNPAHGIHAPIGFQWTDPQRLA